MKKLLFALLTGLLLNASAIAQTTKPAPAKATEIKAKVVPTKSATTTAVVLKKDGTPDKRYNTTAAKVPLKKDGTPDKRYKENKKN